jgi:hypothetical protein
MSTPDPDPYPNSFIGNLIEWLADELNNISPREQAETFQSLRNAMVVQHRQGEFRTGEEVDIFANRPLQGIYIGPPDGDRIASVWVPGGERRVPVDQLRSGRPMPFIHTDDGNVIQNPRDAERRLVEVTRQLEGNPSLPLEEMKVLRKAQVAITCELANWSGYTIPEIAKRAKSQANAAAEAPSRAKASPVDICRNEINSIVRAHPEGPPTSTSRRRPPNPGSSGLNQGRPR